MAALRQPAIAQKKAQVHFPGAEKITVFGCHSEDISAEDIGDWLDYAVEQFDTRQPWLESLCQTCFDDAAVELDRDQIRESGRLELRLLRQALKAGGG